MTASRRTAILLGFLMALGCSDGPYSPEVVEPQLDVSAADKPGDALLVDAVPDQCVTPGPSTLNSTAPGTSVLKTYAVQWPAGAVVLTPQGSDVPLEGTSLSMGRKGGAIVKVIVFMRDASDELHQTDWIAVDPPVEPSPAGFTLHVDAAGVDVLRKKTTKGPGRSESVGTICVGDIVFTPAE